jgi:hypothetical protein
MCATPSPPASAAIRTLPLDTGATGAVSVGGGEISQVLDVTVTPGDIESLRVALKQLGIGDRDIGDLERALAEDAAVESPGSLGPATATWLERRTTALADGVTPGLLTELLVRFLS